MTKIKIVYASLTGTNQHVANYLKAKLLAVGASVTASEMSQTAAASLADVDIAIVTSYTNDNELPEEALAFYEELQDLELPQLRFAVCGTGDTAYPQFCTAVDLFESAFLGTGALPAARSVKLDATAGKVDLAVLDPLIARLTIVITTPR
ncbi:flavodoxin domain-containing protein [Lacticaseibacillus nasuensis]|uniref:flavodoxin domain-containing protein n=1 Tax=Lacticaseibacillus nasuensis TaxID=944671 RepID=UPI0022459123|nr:flavodoxin domain-containing protein [Lacticaseibacillus nasuensis]MCX2454693.1 flavodoxin domain-containing protein [Lacticaseibacillus nasuensis]